MLRIFASLVALTLVLFPGSPSEAKAHLVAVFTLRSAPNLNDQAAILTKEIASGLAALEGYDAQTLGLPAREPSAIAAQHGAEYYVVGQVVGTAGHLQVILASYSVATDHQVASQTVDIPQGHFAAGFDWAALIGGGASTASVAPTASGAATTNGAPNRFAFVPFAPPDNKDTALDFAASEFVKKLQAHGIAATQTPAMDPVAAAASVAQLCKQDGVGGIFIGSARHEQTYNAFWGDRPTHAEVRVTLLNCDGSVRWKGFGTGDVKYWWSNAGAAVSDAIDQSLDAIMNQLQGLVSRQGTVPTPSPSPK